jgi:polar amino acid transport system substrate-binding protein
MRYLLVAVTALVSAVPAFAQERKFLRWGGDPVGGGPFIYKEVGDKPANPNDETDEKNYRGFEIELARYLAKEVGRESKFISGDWDKLPELLKQPVTDDAGIDIVLNGYELREDLNKDYPATVPYYAYRLSLIIHKDNANIIRKWGDLANGIEDNGNLRKIKVGVLGGSVAHEYLKTKFGDKIELLVNPDVATVTGLLERKQDMDATVQDSPAAKFYIGRSTKLLEVGDAQKPGYYVIYTRDADKELREKINTAIKKGLKDGTLRKLYRKYGLWNADQEWLCKEVTGEFPVEDEDEVGELLPTAGKADWSRMFRELLRAAGMTVFLAVASFPIAMLIGMFVALGRVYGPLLVRFPLGLYVEFLRGTPLLLQLYFVFYLLPQLIPGFSLSPIQAGILGLAINYSAYEAENYRAGLLAIPRGQMEAALALGMNPLTALRVVIVPQAVRIVIPPVTNDFIALFKDTSVCSVILITELTRKYNELYNFNREYIVQLAFITAGLYLVMSYPLAILARLLEKRLSKNGGTQR